MRYAKPFTYFICLLATGSALAAGEAAKPAPKLDPTAPILRISAIDGVENPNHKASIKRVYDKKISFSADFFVKENGKLVPQHANAEDIIWTVNMGKKSVTCDPARAAKCKYNSIEPSKDGISIIVFGGVRGMGDMLDPKFTITASSAKDKSVSDKIVIINQTEIDRVQSNKESARDQAEIAAKQSGLGGLFSSFFSSASSSSAEPSGDDDFYLRQSERNARQEKRELMERLKVNSPSVYRDLHQIDVNRYEEMHANDERNRELLRDHR